MHTAPRAVLGASLFVAAALASACIDGPPSSDTSIQRDAESEWLAKGFPAVAACAECHAGSDPSIAFLAGATPLEVRTTLLSFTPAIVRLDEPTNSRLLTKGHHEGLPLTAQESADVLDWLAQEQLAP